MPPTRSTTPAAYATSAIVQGAAHSSETTTRALHHRPLAAARERRPISAGRRSARASRARRRRSRSPAARWPGSRPGRPTAGEPRSPSTACPSTTVDLAHGTTQYRRLVFGHAWASSAAHTHDASPSWARRGTRTWTSTGSSSSIRPRPTRCSSGRATSPPAASPATRGRPPCSTASPGRVFAAGDLAYPDGHRRPVPRLLRPDLGPLEGDRTSSGARQPRVRQRRARRRYFAYFGARGRLDGRRAGTPTTSARGACMSSTRTARQVGCGAGLRRRARGSRADLAANPRTCVAARAGITRGSRPGEHGNNPAVAELWRALEEAGAEVVLTGHDHDYERFAPADGRPRRRPGRHPRVRRRDRRRRAAVVRVAAKLNSVVRSSSTYGVLKLTLPCGRRTTGGSCRSPAGRSLTRAAATCH